MVGPARPERAKIGPKFRAGSQILGPTRNGPDKRAILIQVPNLN